MTRKAIFLLLIVIVFTTCKKKQQGPNDIFMSGNSYSPSSLTVAAGTTVKWTNNESAVHTVSSDNGAFTSSGDIAKKKTYSFTFATPGTYPYHCMHHSGMSGVVNVQ